MLMISASVAQRSTILIIGLRLKCSLVDMFFV